MKWLETKKILFIGSFSVIALFLGFFTNYWRVADQDWFDTHQYDMESYLIGRMVKSRQDGIFSDGGLMGLGSLKGTSACHITAHFHNQNRAYLNNLPFETYATYHSLIGGQGIFFSILDKLITALPRLNKWVIAFPIKKLHLFHALTSLATAVTLTCIILWFYWEFGLTVSVIVLLSTVFSQWLAVFGRNLYWSMWAFYLPMVAFMYYFKSDGRLSNNHLFKLGGLALIAIFIKCLFTGYEYITSTLVMMVVPVVYYFVLRRVNFRDSLKGLVTIGLGAVLGLLLSFGILFFQIMSVQGHWGDGVEHIIYALKRRTYADPHDLPPAYAPDMEAGPLSVIGTYLDGSFLDVKIHLLSNLYIIEIKYFYLIILFVAMSVMLYINRKRYVAEKEERKPIALICATWFSILAPLSWFIIFKAHSHSHTHMNYIVWQMPFVIFGFALCGLLVKRAFQPKIFNHGRFRRRI